LAGSAQIQNSLRLILVCNFPLNQALNLTRYVGALRLAEEEEMVPGTMSLYMEAANDLLDQLEAYGLFASSNRFLEPLSSPA